MASGDVTLTNYGTFDLSGAALKTTVDTINIQKAASGAALYLIPYGNRQVQVIKTAITT